MLSQFDVELFQVPGPEDDMNTGAPKLLRLIGRYVGYHPAVIEQVRHSHVIQLPLNAVDD